MNLIILTADDACDDDRYVLTDARATHIRTVLRAQVGDSIEVGLLNGPQGLAVLEFISQNEVRLKAGNLREIGPPMPTIGLICALPRPQTLKKILLTCGMMGVRSLDLIRANRVEKSYYHSPLLQTENYTPYLIEGLSQGKSTHLPEVTIHDRFKPFFEDTLPAREVAMNGPAARLLPHPEATVRLEAVLGQESAIWLAVGPEGGWVPFEIELMESIGFRRFSLGPWVLRVEHAVIASLAQLELSRGAQHQP